MTAITPAERAARIERVQAELQAARLDRQLIDDGDTGRVDVVIRHLEQERNALTGGLNLLRLMEQLEATARVTVAFVRTAVRGYRLTTQSVPYPAVVRTRSFDDEVDVIVWLLRETEKARTEGVDDGQRTQRIRVPNLRDAG